MPLAGLRPLRHRRFALFWGAGAASDMGTWVQLAAIGSLVASSSGSAVSTGLIAAATFAPQGVCSPIGGIMADRVDRRRLFLVTLGLQTVLTSVIAIVVASGVRNPASLALLVMFQSGAGAFGGPALQAILPDLVPRNELTSAVSLGLIGWNAGRVLGPIIAAVLVPFGTQWAIIVNAISFVILWVAIASIRVRFPPAPRVSMSAVRELADGARALVRTRSCVMVVATVAVINLLYIPFMGLMPITASELLRRGGHRSGDDSAVTRTASFLLSAQGIGAMVGALALASILMTHRRSHVIRVALLIGAFALPLHVWSAHLASSMLVVAILGGTTAMAVSSLGGVVQRDAPSEHRGRILSWYQGTMGTTYGIGLWVLGHSVDRFGEISTFVISGAVLAAFALAVGWRVRAWRDAIDGQRAELIDAVRSPAAVAD